MAGPRSSAWTDAQIAVMRHMHAWALSVAQLNQHFAGWMGLSSSEARALSLILGAADEGQPLTPVDLSRQTGMTSGATSVLLNRLEDAGHITRSREHADRRRVTLRPTPATARQAAEFLGISGSEPVEVLQGTPPEQLPQIIEFVSRITAASQDANRRLEQHHAPRPNSPRRRPRRSRP